MTKPVIPNRSDYFIFFDIATRWSDNDAYGHVNNVTYYAYFDTIINRYLIEHGGFDIQHSQQIGYIVNSQCAYHASIAFPEALIGGLRVNRVGSSSVEYGVAIFKQGQEIACAHGQMTHVFVDRETEKPLKIDGVLRAALEKARMD